MTDFWFTFGAMTIDPGFWDDIVKSEPSFQRIGMTIEETVAGVKQKPLDVPAAGYLDETATTALRGLLRDYAGKNYGAAAPIMSLYNAGKMCQFVNTFQAGLTKAIRKANKQFKAAAKSAGLKAPYSARFAILLGASLIDPLLCGALHKAIECDVAKEFGIDPAQGTAEWKTILAFTADTPDHAFQKMQEALRAAPSWTPHCTEVSIYYEPFKRAAN